jgi:hypothetical protein
VPAALELVVIEVHHAVPAARDGGQELALRHVLIPAVALGAHHSALLRLTLLRPHGWVQATEAVQAARGAAAAFSAGAAGVEL